ncbi:MAG: cobalamin biosynthesis protein [Dehalococcoidia bacterium]|nr:cobalamin biosynthesis protein [Dehalococcoidia bacterium]
MADFTILILAIAMDLLLGEPPPFAHPVVWVGGLIAIFKRLAPAGWVWLQFVYGVMAVLIATALLGGLSYYILGFLHENNFLGYILIGVFLLKGSFSVRALHAAATRVGLLLDEGEIEEARFYLRDLVSRDASSLDKPLIAAAAVESVAENITDSLVAPLFYFLLFGVPGALVYRTVNTFDSMIGYRGIYEYLGKFAARLDDLLNFIPARLTALLIVLAAAITGNDVKGAWRIMVRDHGRTASPNAGWTMSAAAGALQVQLEKVSYYTLGDPRRPASSQTIGEVLRLLQVVLAIWVGIILFFEVIHFVLAP